MKRNLAGYILINNRFLSSNRIWIVLILSTKSIVPPTNLSVSEVTENSHILSIAKAKYKNQDFLGALTEYTRIIQLNPHHALAYCEHC
jgi:hypothetical protein